MINNTIYWVLVLLSGITYVLLMSLPYSIAIFYHKVFKKKVYSYLFLLAGIFFILSIVYSYDIFSIAGSGFFAAGGFVLAAASIRLYIVMMGGD